MKPRTCANAFLATLALLVVCPGGIASTYQNDDDAAIDAYIARQAQRERGQEYREARKVVVGDLTHDNVPETVVLYTIEGQRGTNRHTQYLAVFSRQNGQLKPITHAAMGSKSVGGVKLRSVEDESIVLDTLSYAAKDAECCPSIPGSTRYVLSGRTLREQKKGASKGGRASARGGTGTFQRSFSFRDFRALQALRLGNQSSNVKERSDPVSGRATGCHR
jgi:hypothetical protein